jgi:transposase
MRQDIFVGVERRRRWADSEKLRILEEVGIDGASVSDVARRYDVTRQHLYTWRRQLGDKCAVLSNDAVFFPVELSDAPEACASSAHGRQADVSQVEVMLGNGRSLRIGTDIADGALVRLLRIVESA